MRPIDADALINEIKKETKKAIEQDDKVGSFWLGYIAGLVIKQPTIQSALEPETLIRTIEMGITATNSNDAYSLGMRNGMRWCKSLIDGVEPKFEDDMTRVDDGKELPSAQPERKEGHWIWAAGELVCSECHTIYSDLYPDYDNAVACPHCGAKMTISK